MQVFSDYYYYYYYYTATTTTKAATYTQKLWPAGLLKVMIALRPHAKSPVAELQGTLHDLLIRVSIVWSNPGCLDLCGSNLNSTREFLELKTSQHAMEPACLPVPVSLFLHFPSQGMSALLIACILRMTSATCQNMNCKFLWRQECVACYFCCSLIPSWLYSI